MTFNISKVLILETRPDLCRMVVTWGDVNHKLTSEDLLRDWSVLAGVPVRVVSQNRILLLRLGIIKDAGLVEGSALALVKRMAIDRVKGRRK